jgi:hypothetical protein
MLAVKRYSQLPEDNYQKGVLFMTKITSHWRLLVAFLILNFSILPNLTGSICFQAAISLKSP